MACVIYISRYKVLLSCLSVSEVNTMVVLGIIIFFDPIKLNNIKLDVEEGRNVNNLPRIIDQKSCFLF